MLEEAQNEEPIHFKKEQILMTTQRWFVKRPRLWGLLCGLTLAVAQLFTPATLGTAQAATTTCTPQRRHPKLHRHLQRQRRSRKLDRTHWRNQRHL